MFSGQNVFVRNGTRLETGGDSRPGGYVHSIARSIRSIRSNGELFEMKATRRSNVLTHLALFGILVSFAASPAAATQPTAGAKASTAKRAGALDAYAQDLTSAAR